MARLPLNKLALLDLGYGKETEDGSVDPTPFDFETELPAGAREDVKSRITVLLVRLNKAIIEIGQDLIHIRTIIREHGTKGAWSRFLATGLPFSESSARNYIKAAEVANSATVEEVAQLAPTAMYQLARASDDVRRDVDLLLRDRKAVTATDVKAMTKRAPLVAERHDRVAEQHSSISQADTEGLEPKTWPRADGARTHLLVENKSGIAARKLVARLRKHFCDSDIHLLNDLWQQAGFTEIQRILSEKQ